MSYLEQAPQSSDPVRPGEQWFCYWKTSAALWESRILQCRPEEILFIPIPWGFHAEGPDSWDFGQFHPERDLLRLAQLLQQHHRKFCWLLPLSPFPFVPNGGVPVTAARTLSISKDGVHLTTLDQDETLHKVYSYFEPKVFQNFVDFLGAFGKFLGQNKIKAPLWGAVFSFQEGDQNISFMADRSVAFEQGFSRYLKQNHREGIDLTDPREEENLKLKFTREVQDLFRTTAETALAPFWIGAQNITVLGGSPAETLERLLPGGRSQLTYVRDLMDHYTHGRWISSALLKAKEKGELLPKLLAEHMGPPEIERRYNYNRAVGEMGPEWRPYGIVDVFGDDHGPFEATGLLGFLSNHFPSVFGIHRSFSFTTEWIEENEHKVKFFHGASLDRTTMGQVLKLFMMGQKVVVDKSGLSTELDKRLQIFLMENDLKVQTVNFLTPMTLTELGEGRLITYEGARLTKETGPKFWPQLFRYFNLSHVDINLGDDVFGLWRIRSSTPHELNFLDVRRVNLYNPTSYKKQVSIQTKHGFAFMKMIDPSKAQARSTGSTVEVELLPNGRIALDFGHYEEA